ncbi:MAG TPA: transporter, partial [Planctomycetota bacterium]|nr:transporter [Planctomycetota bacterium]
MIAALLLAGLTFAQEGTLDVLDGETLYEGGWLFTLGTEIEKREGLRRGTSRVSDPLDRRLTGVTTAVSAHYGLRYNVQVSAILPWIDRELKLDDPSGPDRISASGPGDLSLVAKWRFYRWDDVGKAANFAILAGIEAPSGEDDEHAPPELQPGSGSWDPSIGAAATYEPGRWRFNAAALYKRNGKGTEDFRFGDEFFAELAAGNRFWLEPYPGPFMRFDVLMRYRHQGRATDGGSEVAD